MKHHSTARGNWGTGARWVFSRTRLCLQQCHLCQLSVLLCLQHCFNKHSFSSGAFTRISLGMCFSTWVFCGGWNRRRNIFLFTHNGYPASCYPGLSPGRCSLELPDAGLHLSLILPTSWSPTQSASPCCGNKTSSCAGAIPGVAAPLQSWILIRKLDEEWFDFCNEWCCRFIYFSQLSESTPALQGHHIWAYIFYFFK